MARPSPRVVVMLQVQWPYKRHSEIFAGVQRYAQEQGWVSIYLLLAMKCTQRLRVTAVGERPMVSAGDGVLP